MRDIFVSLLILGLFPACFRRPFIGLLIFSWLAYMRPQDLTWGFARGQRWSFYVAIIMAVGFLVSKQRKRFFLPDIRCWLMIVLALLIGIGIPLGTSPEARQFTRYLEFLKIVGVALFTTGVIVNREQLRIMIWVIALSLGFFGVKSGIWGLVTFGGSPILRGPGGMMRDNNDFSLALVMSLPMLWHIGMSEKREVLRRAFLAAVPLTGITVLLTHSRGGMLSMTATYLALVWRSRNRVGGIAVMVLAATAAIIVAPSELKDRAASIGKYEEDSSAKARLRAWAVAVRMASANPILGVGFNRFGRNYLRYEPNPTEKQMMGEDIFVAHNSYLQVWAECGTPAFAIYMSLILLSFLTVWKVRALAQRRYYASWIINYATMFEASLVGFMVGSTFLNRAHFDLFYHWVAVILVFGHIAMQEMENEGSYPVRLEGGMRGTIESRGRRGFERRPTVRGFRNTPLGPQKPGLA